MGKTALWIIVLVIIVAGGWYLMNNTQTVPVQVEGWETYTSEQWGFAIQYPDTVTINQLDAHSTRFLLLGPSQSIGTEMYDGISLGITHKIYEGNFKDSVDAGLAEDVKHSEIVEPLKATRLGGVNGYTYSISGLGRFTNVYLPIDEDEYLLVAYLVEDPTDAGFGDTVDKMLGSLVVGI